jgi:hypothetical protein
VTPLKVRFTYEDAERAWREWGCNCGPSAIAAMLRLTLDEVRPYLGEFEQKKYTNPQLMYWILDYLKAAGHGRAWRLVPASRWPTWGLVRVQWEGPWTAASAPWRAKCRYTHWIGAATAGEARGVWDVNCLNNTTGWVSFAEWQRVIVPAITDQMPKANGLWHPTHVLEIEPSDA